jgi:hypothetical protein
MKRLLVTTQLSNFVNGKVDLACDSGWQMTINRVREMLRLNLDLCVDIMCPTADQLVQLPADVNPDLAELYGEIAVPRLHIIEHPIVTSALITRYDFKWERIAEALDLAPHKADVEQRYDAVYVNDPMQLRAFKAMFHVVGGYQPKFYVHSHFVDIPEVPKFPAEASLWLGQCEATLKADYNFWQCESAMEQFFTSMGKWFVQDVVDDVRAKSEPWDDGYSIAEITSPIDVNNLRFTEAHWHAVTQGKTVLFFPNRISPASGDYTNGMKLMFEQLPRLRQHRQDFVVVCGNPNLKFSNDVLAERCGPNGYVKLHDFTLNRDEFKFVAAHSHIALGLYNVDPYGGTAARECVELGCMPLWLDNFAYSALARKAGIDHWLAKPDFSDFVIRASRLIDLFTGDAGDMAYVKEKVALLQSVVRGQCSYEATTPTAMRRMGLL